MRDFNTRWYNYPNRTLCEILREMRELCEKTNIFNQKYTISCMKGLIEEAQTMGNRMEGAMEDWSDIRTIHEERRKLNKELEDLSKEANELSASLNKDKEE